MKLTISFKFAFVARSRSVMTDMFSLRIRLAVLFHLAMCISPITYSARPSGMTPVQWIWAILTMNFWSPVRFSSTSSGNSTGGNS